MALPGRPGLGRAGRRDALAAARRTDRLAVGHRRTDRVAVCQCGPRGRPRGPGRAQPRAGSTQRASTGARTGPARPAPRLGREGRRAAADPAAALAHAGADLGALVARETAVSAG